MVEAVLYGEEIEIVAPTSENQLMVFPGSLLTSFSISVKSKSPVPFPKSQTAATALFAVGAAVTFNKIGIIGDVQFPLVAAA